ncbi:hypothetical protein PMAYCL1PPCAC_17205 [Pristionchus mayeri]|uniref:Uncharacterized protein n=1 Tax=Pristionchus mayeri TaxID=1317129 RepID=A0AAN5I083_9BILA|nr:hypothetical protein PMAYCL1PPCAC_17205 [Pristionchus mayeri]
MQDTCRHTENIYEGKRKGLGSLVPHESFAVDGGIAIEDCIERLAQGTEPDSIDASHALEWTDAVRETQRVVIVDTTRADSRCVLNWFETIRQLIRLEGTFIVKKNAAVVSTQGNGSISTALFAFLPRSFLDLLLWFVFGFNWAVLGFGRLVLRLDWKISTSDRVLHRHDRELSSLGSLMFDVNCVLFCFNRTLFFYDRVEFSFVPLVHLGSVVFIASCIIHDRLRNVTRHAWLARVRRPPPRGRHYECQ